MNHLEQLVAEWLQILRPLSSSSWSSSSRWFEGELDVVGINLVRNHLLHIEWGLPLPDVRDKIVNPAPAATHNRGISGGEIPLACHCRRPKQRSQLCFL